MKKMRQKNNKRKWWLVIGIGVVLSIVGFGYWWFTFRVDESGIPVGKVSYEFVSSRPEATLYYPGAKVFQKFGLGQRQNGTVAFAGAIMRTNDSPEKIYAWYKQWLLSHGWSVDEKGLPRAGTQVTLQSYLRGTREIFYVAMDDPKQLSWTLGKQVPTNVTVFEFVEMIKAKP